MTIVFFIISGFLWGAAIGYGVPAFIDWTKRKAAELDEMEAV